MKTTFENLLGVKIKNIELFQEAVTHSSYLPVINFESPSNQRLEFLGDSVLDLVVSEYLFNESDSREGELTINKSIMVSNKTLAHCTKELGLDKYLLVNKSVTEELKQGRGVKALADLLEAIVGAIYLDSGLKEVYRFVTEKIIPILDKPNFVAPINFKSQLLEAVLPNRDNTPPTYHILAKWGDYHQPHFEVGVYLGNELLGRGVGNTKKRAEQDAAKQALIMLNL